MKTRFRLTGKQRDSYLELVQVFPLTSIRSDEHLEAAQEMVDELLAKGDLTKASNCTLTGSVIWSLTTRTNTMPSSRLRTPICFDT